MGSQGIMYREVCSQHCRMLKSQIVGLTLTGIGFALSVFSLIFLTTCSGPLTLGVSCTPNFFWPVLAPGLVLQIVGVGISLRSGRESSTSKPSEPSTR